MDKIVFVLLHGSPYFCNRYSNSLIMNRNSLFFFSLCLSLCMVTPSVATSLYGIERMLAVDSLPVLDCGVHVRYEGSIDKRGLNADWDWSLYQDSNGEWVIFDVKGAGCIYNMVQHRYLSSSDPTFRFYFDGETTPRFSLKLSEFGTKYPFVAPLATAYIGPLDSGRGPIRVARSFVPMPFARSCKITTDVRLQGADRSRGEGGWGHVVYQVYADTISGSFTGNEDYTAVKRLWRQTGVLPHGRRTDDKAVTLSDKTIAPGDSLCLLAADAPGVLRALRLYLPGLDYEGLQQLWISVSCDNHTQPDVACPVGCLAGNSLGYNNTSYLLNGYSTDGSIYSYFPMPFWQSVRVVLTNRSSRPVSLAFAEAVVAPNRYDADRTGYFRNTPYYTRKHVEGKDSPIGTVTGTGKMVAAHVTCYAEREHIISCEGDVRVYIDGCRTPQVESDGSESYVCFGWGFPTPAEGHPSGGYDGLSDNPWSMTRLCMGDSYPFYRSLAFGIESGEHNNQYLEHAGTIFYYGRDEVTMQPVDSLILSDARSRRAHHYKTYGETDVQRLENTFEGDCLHTRVAADVYRSTEGSSFRIALPADNRGICLRRMSDNATGRQLARVFVDGEELPAPWYVADSNAYIRWLEDDFDIPARYTAGKSSIEIRIVPVAPARGGQIYWNEAEYRVFAYR